MTVFALIYGIIVHFVVSFAVVLNDASMIVSMEYSRQVVSVCCSLRPKDMFERYAAYSGDIRTYARFEMHVREGSSRPSLLAILYKHMRRMVAPVNTWGIKKNVRVRQIVHETLHRMANIMFFDPNSPFVPQQYCCWTVPSKHLSAILL